MIRICTLALVATSYLHTVQSNGPRPQGVWSTAVRSGSIVTEGASADTAELGDRRVARLPTGVQSLLRLTTTRQTDLRPDLRKIEIEGPDATFAARVRELEERAAQSRPPDAGADRLTTLEKKVATLKEGAAVTTKALEDSRTQVARTREDLAKSESSWLCRFSTYTCGTDITAERSAAHSAEDGLKKLEAQSDFQKRELTQASAALDDLRHQAERTRQTTKRSAPGTTLASGFYETESTPTCKRRLVLRIVPGAPLAESPLVDEDTAPEDLNLGESTIYACVDRKKRVIGVEATDRTGAVQATSKIERDRRGRIENISILDSSSRTLERHQWNLKGNAYAIIYHGPKGDQARAIIQSPGTR